MVVNIQKLIKQGLTFTNGQLFFNNGPKIWKLNVRVPTYTSWKKMLIFLLPNYPFTAIKFVSQFSPIKLSLLYHQTWLLSFATTFSEQNV
jgi:hypothetical protein